MKEIRIMNDKNLNIKFDIQHALLYAGYKPELPGFEKANAFATENTDLLKRLVQPRAVLGATDQEDTLFLFTTLGQAVERQISSFHEDGEDLEAALFSAMSDSYLFAFAEALRPELISYAQSFGRGITSCEAPDASEYIPVVREFIENTGLKISINDAGVMKPAKSLISKFSLPESQEIYLASSCTTCAMREGCPARKPADSKDSETSSPDSQPSKLVCPANKNLLTSIQEAGFQLAAPCNGNGTCGKCKVQVLNEEVDILSLSNVELRMLSESEISNGVRMACQAKYDHDVTITLPSQNLSTIEANESDQVDLADSDISEFASEQADNDSDSSEDSLVYTRGSLAVDLGTTTIAMRLYLEASNLSEENIPLPRTATFSATCLNSQNGYGADVVSRIVAAKTVADSLQTLAISDFHRLFKNLLKQAKAKKNVSDNFELIKIVVSANTTMEHLLLHQSVEGLGSYPFHPVTLGLQKMTASTILGESFPGISDDTDLIVLPGFTTYVGADIIAGVYHLDMDLSQDVNLLLDLGTNGEMVLGNHSHFCLASTAVGPAFEGGNLTYGVGGIPGAIQAIHPKKVIRPSMAAEMYENPEEFFDFDLIPGETELTGITGAGAISILAYLVKHRLVDQYGTFVPAFFEKGFPLGFKKSYTDRKYLITLSQDDIRQLQLAKAAIRAGVETLIRKSRFSIHDIKNVYIAGGFGYYLNREDAATIGLLPEELLDEKKYHAVGNTSLAGSSKLLEHTLGNNENASRLTYARIKSIARRADEIILGNEPGFEEAYIQEMNFKQPRQGHI